MKKLIISLALAAAAAFSANAQIRVEVLGNLADLTFTASDEKATSSSNFGFGVRGFYNLYSFSDVNLEAGIGYMSDSSSINYGGGVSSTSKLGYIQIPVRVSYDWNIGSFTITPAFGLYAGYAITGKSITNAGSVSGSVSPFNDSSEVGHGTMKRFDFGTDDELIFTYADRYSIAIGIQKGFVNINAADGTKCTRSTLYFGLGYAF